MNPTRNAILARLRSASKLQDNMVNQRLQQHGRGPLPALNAQLLERFVNKMTANSASVEVVKDDRSLVNSVKLFLQRHNLPLSLCMVNHPLLSGLPWSDELQIDKRFVSHHDLTVLSVATAALAETGSVVMLSGEQTPTEANFLPDNFICIVNQLDIVAYMEDLWDRLRQQGQTLPAVVNIVSGPSRTADVEQTIQLGAHGPRRMHVLIRG